MTTKALLAQAKPASIGKRPVVVLPLSAWRKIEDKLEDAEMMGAVKLRKKIARGRAERKLYTPAQVKKMLGV